jgi:rare lipoprotein A (peptidoglycan hydrolase)
LGHIDLPGKDCVSVTVPVHSLKSLSVSSMIQRLGGLVSLYVSSLVVSVLTPAALANDTTSVSWYGPGLEGNYTASGEPFDRWEHTAAHPNWPFGTLVKLTNPSTGGSVTVRINDRSGSRLDISEQAAIDLGIHAQGVARVEVEIVQWGD